MGTPVTAWDELARGNTRYVSGEVTAGQGFTPPGPHCPVAAVLSCSDARVPPELIFDAPVGALFSVRTAGHTVDSAVLGSLEFAVSELGAHLVLVMGHTGCGAIGAAWALEADALRPLGHIATIADRIMASAQLGAGNAEELGRRHVDACVYQLQQRSALLREESRRGGISIIGAQYQLATGEVVRL